MRDRRATPAMPFLAGLRFLKSPGCVLSEKKTTRVAPYIYTAALVILYIAGCRFEAPYLQGRFDVVNTTREPPSSDNNFPLRANYDLANTPFESP